MLSTTTVQHQAVSRGHLGLTLLCLTAKFGCDHVQQQDYIEWGSLRLRMGFTQLSYEQTSGGPRPLVDAGASGPAGQTRVCLA